MIHTAGKNQSKAYLQMPQQLLWCAFYLDGLFRMLPSSDSIPAKWTIGNRFEAAAGMARCCMHAIQIEGLAHKIAHLR